MRQWACPYYVGVRQYLHVALKACLRLGLPCEPGELFLVHNLDTTAALLADAGPGESSADAHVMAAEMAFLVLAARVTLVKGRFAPLERRHPFVALIPLHPLPSMAVRILKFRPRLLSAG